MYLIYRFIISVHTINVIAVYPIVYFSVSDPMKQDFIAYRYFRMTQLVWYSILFFVVIIVVVMLLRKLKQV